MLYEIECSKFATRVNGKFVPRGKIRFREGLNTVLGDKAAQNSIGKSTFLLIIDFCFGGGDYVNEKISNAKENVHTHTINFAFKFGDRIDYFCRCTATPDEVGICNERYQIIDTQSIAEFRDYLKKAYEITLPIISFRDIVGRYLRIYGRENYAERFPLKYGDEPVADAIIALEKLLNVYAFIQEYKDVYDNRAARKSARKKATDLGEMTNVARTRTQYKANEKEIAVLEKQLEELVNHEDADLSGTNVANVDKAAEIKGRLTVLTRKRSRLRSQLNSVKANMEGGLVPGEDDLSELAEFFPEVDMQKLSMIDNFHRKMQTILTGEMSEEIAHLEVLIDAVSDEMKKLEEEQRQLGVPVNISKKFMQKYVEMQRRIDILTAQNRGYNATTQLAAETKVAKKNLEDVREQQLKEVQASINQEMTILNDFIYDGKRYAPEISFGNGRTGKPTYEFETLGDKGAGTNFKGLIIFDLAMLRLSQLPVIAHDSNIFKNIADLPIDKIMELYKQSKKQIFIAFDKENAFYEITRNIVRETTVIELKADGGELFGWSWAEKNPEEKKVETETTEN